MAKFKVGDIILVNWTEGPDFIKITETKDIGINRISHMYGFDFLTGPMMGESSGRIQETIEKLGKKVEGKTFEILFGEKYS